MDCAHCGTSACEVNHSGKHGAWTCLRCYLRPAPIGRLIRMVLDAEPATRAEMARRVGRDPRDGSVGRALSRLVSDGLAVREHDGYRSAATP